jgi:hypothetical protein
VSSPDGIQIQQVVLNWRHGGGDGGSVFLVRVVLAVERSSQSDLVVRVSDNGPRSARPGGADLRALLLDQKRPGWASAWRSAARSSELMAVRSRAPWA